MSVDVLVVGGGIIGLASARALLRADPGLRVALLEAEDTWAAHQSGHNSNVIHSGIYYQPGSLKARLARAGGEAMIAYCHRHDLPVRRTGKLIAATAQSQLAPMRELARRGEANGVHLTRIGPERARELEPSVTCVAALDVADTAITDFPAVARSYATWLTGHGAELRTGAPVVRIDRRQHESVVHTRAGDAVATRALVNCAGLFSDRIARMAGVDPGVRIQPFRGEYHALAQHSGTSIGRPVYPVPDPDLPFLGVHLTPSVTGEVHVGPNAVPAFSRTGYRWRDVQPGTALAWVRDPAMRALARSYWRDGAREIARSVTKPMLVRDVRRLLPAVASADLSRSGAGVRAQAVADDGSLVDDFVVRYDVNTVHVLNAPSPAATSSLLIGQYVAGLTRRILGADHTAGLDEIIASAVTE